jgi:hypothetical protein
VFQMGVPHALADPLADGECDYHSPEAMDGTNDLASRYLITIHTSKRRVVGGRAAAAQTVLTSSLCSIPVC